MTHACVTSLSKTNTFAVFFYIFVKRYQCRECSFFHQLLLAKVNLFSLKLVLLTFYGLAVKTGIALSIALQKVFFLLFFFFLWRKKVRYLGSKYYFPDSSQKTNATLKLSFFDILASFEVKNVCALFREIE